MNDINNIVRRTLLFDFYGVLLTENQKKIYEEVVFNDYSISEVASDEGISRQSVHDMIRRTDKLLEEYEEKLHLVEKFKKVEELVKQIEDADLAGKILDSF